MGCPGHSFSEGLLSGLPERNAPIAHITINRAAYVVSGLPLSVMLETWPDRTACIWPNEPACIVA